MWLMTEHGFVSVVQHRTKKGHLLVRSRTKKHLTTIHNLTGKQYRILYTPDADYSYRMVVPTKILADLFHRLLCDLDYDNFKNRVHDHDGDHEYLTFLHTVWADGIATLDHRHRYGW